MTALITGASSGIGEALAREFAGRRYDLVLVARSADKLSALAGSLGKTHGVQVFVLAVDLVAPGAVASVVERARELAGRIDVLVNNAGFGTYGPFAETPLDDELDEIRLNIGVVTELTKRLLPDLKQVKGKILNVASTAAFQPGPLMAVYYATKAYVLSLSEALAVELQPAGVAVTCLCPGPTESGFQARAGISGTRLLRAGMMSSQAVARAGVTGLLAGRHVVVPGFHNRLGAALPRLSPRRTTARVVRWVNDRAGAGRRRS